MTDADGYTCPVCGRTSYNPHDASERYCGRCHGYTSAPPPPGMRWVAFHSIARADFGRLVEERSLAPGSRYELVGEGGAYVYDGERFVEAAT